jgi:hypothetical protein
MDNTHHMTRKKLVGVHSFVPKGLLAAVAAQHCQQLTWAWLRSKFTSNKSSKTQGL